ncbi:ubiquitin carboxyl-terminal hydrolase CYLD-like isoform X3 [Ornithodoros turicata]|uniref:ubiquitin carboxyl-terminal hydrolase CYLD-like isoform X3 n=1 Tax=Ornithodoros turicata TaxID=34597 RepID=UPI003139AD08
MNCMCSKKRSSKDGEIYLPRPSSLSAPKLPSKKKSLPPTPRELHHSSTACATSSTVPTQKDACPIELNDRVVWVSDHGPEYGRVRWLGHLHDTSPDLMVGVEFDNRVGTGTGKYREQQLFEAKLGHASLVPVLGLLRAEDYQCEQDTGTFPSSSTRPQARHEFSAMSNASSDRNYQSDNSAIGLPNERLNTALQRNKEGYPQDKPGRSPRSPVPSRIVDEERFSKRTDSEYPPLGKDDLDKMKGRGKGIQGHHNSCYLDATLFAMFACTHVFDSILYRERSSDDIDRYDEVRHVLKDDIVNPLRKGQYVPHGNVMKLRHLLDQLSNVSGLTTEEKDPEEFLNSLTQILKVEPFLLLSSGQQTHLYQLFVEKDKFLDIPTVQQLFHQSIFESNIKFKKVPSKLIIQMPRFGRQFKVYSRVLPSLKLDITDILENSPRFCFVCGRRASYECRQCFRADIGLEGIGYCKHCEQSVHQHPDRKGHKLDKLGNIPGFSEGSPTARTCMDLFAVVCIETSHYVCFVKCGDDDSAPWCFFDSMADREGCENGYNIPEVDEFLDFNSYVGKSGIEKLQELTDDKMLPRLGRKLVCDAYMCMYLDKTVRQYE